MEKVKFNQMKDGTKEEYLFLDKHEQKYINGTFLEISPWKPHRAIEICIFLKVTKNLSKKYSARKFLYLNFKNGKKEES